MTSCPACRAEVQEPGPCALCAHLSTVWSSVQVGGVFDVSPVVVGIDPSRTACGVVALDGFGVKGGDVFRTKAGQRHETRVNEIARAAAGFVYDHVEHSSSVIFIEANFVGPNPQGDLLNRELIGALRLDLWRAGHQIHMVNNKAGKKALTGSGKASKVQMVEAALKFPGFASKVDGPKYYLEAVADSLGVLLAGAKSWEAE